MALASLQRHALFSFQIRDAQVAARVRELRALLGAAAGEPDARELLAELVFEVEERLLGAADARDLFLLAALQKFAQEVELLADVEDSGEQAVVVTTKAAEEPRRTQREAERPPPTTASDDDARCGVCGQPDSLESDPIVICEICGVAVHQTCYRIDELPEGDWFCQPCARYTHEQLAGGNAALEPTHEIECQACMTKGGALVPSSTAAVRDGWVHLVCTMFLPELYVLSTNRLTLPGTGMAEQQIFGGAEKLGARRKLRCCFCKTSDKGACGQCVVGKCATAYHPLCAVRNGIQVRFLDENNQFGSACLRHQPEFLRSQGAEFNKTNSELTAHESKSILGDTQQQSRIRQATSDSVAGAPSKRKRSGRNPWSDDEEEEVHSVLDSESDPDDLDSDLSDSDVEIIDVSQPSSDRNSTTSSQRPPSKRTKQSKLAFNQPSAATKPPTTQSQTSPAAIPSTAPPPPPIPSTQVSTSSSSLGRVGEDMAESTIFAPVLEPPRLIARPNDPSEKNFQYVMVLCWKQPLGIGISTSKLRGRMAIVLKSATTRNPSAISALKKGVIEDNDEIVAFNDVKLHNVDASEIGKILPTLTFPIRCWIRTRRRETPQQSISGSAAATTAPPAASSPVEPIATKMNTPAMFASKLPKAVDVSVNDTVATAPAAMAEEVDAEDQKVKENAQPQSASNADAESALLSAALSPDWPWSHYLRSDGKLAMNLFWRSLDAGFFKSKFNKREFEALENRIQELTGICLTPSRPEYEHMRGLLTMPRRERVPAYLIAFRKSRKTKQHFLSSDIFLGVHTEGGAGEETNVDESIPIDVGTTVTVAKRTWPGINKLGGAGRIKKVNEEKLPDGSKRYTYNVGYILGGNEKNIERKYISVVDLNKETEEKAEETPAASDESSVKPDVKHDDDTEDTSVNIRLSLQITQAADEAKVLVLPDQVCEPPPRRRFGLLVSVSDGNLYCERKSPGSNQPPKLLPEHMLQHKFFDRKLNPGDAEITDCFTSQLLRVDDCTGDEIIDAEDDDDDSDEEEENTIKKELIDLQSQLSSITESNEKLFSQLTERVNTEYASRAYRARKLEEIQWKNYERMYTEMTEAKKAFGDSDDDHSDANGADDDGDDGSDDSDEEDETFGGMFVNRVKQEGNEVCVLCELSGGDFAATSCGKVVHPQCAMYTPETFFKDGVVHGINDVVPDRAKLKCNKCGGRKGVSKIQCASKKCTLAYHVACAYVEGLLTREPLYQVWCPRHLKSSGMTAYLELPPHLRKAGGGVGGDATTSAPMPSSDNRSKKSGSGRPRGRPPKQQPHDIQRVRPTAGKGRRETPDAAAPSGGDMTSSKTNRKRKRRNSAGAAQSPNTRRSRQASLDSTDDEKAMGAASDEIRCARRLDIDMESDENELNGTDSTPDDAWRPPAEIDRVFKVNEIVEVQARVGPNVNKLGGVARVKAAKVTAGGGGPSEMFYDVAYVLDNSREKGVPAIHVRSYVAEAAGGNAESSNRKKSRRE